MKKRQHRWFVWWGTFLVALTLAGNARAGVIRDRYLEPTPLPEGSFGDPDVPINPAPHAKLTCALVDVVLKSRTIPLAVLPLFRSRAGVRENAAAVSEPWSRRRP